MEIIDVVIHKNQSYIKFDNTNKGFKALCKWALSQSEACKDNLLFVFEHTGLYSYQLAVYLTNKEFNFSIVPGLEIKRSLGLARGKDDKVDASNIARYGYRLREEIQTTSIDSEEIQSLKNLLSLRERMVKQRSGYKASIGEMKRVLNKSKNKVLFSIQEKMKSKLDKEISNVEKAMYDIVISNEIIKEQYELITSIKGIGPQTTLYLIVLTAGFTKFKNSRCFASYSGIAPFPNQSGTSIRGKTRTSNLANKKIKSLLDLAAKSAIQHNPEMKIYFNKRIEQGKNKMSTVNIIRNKLLSRVFAVITRKTPYVELVKYAA